MNPFSHAFLFIGTSLLDLYAFVIVCRFLFQLHRVDFYNPYAQAIVRFSNPPLIKLRKIIPGLWGLDMASLALFTLLIVAKVVFTIVLVKPVWPNPLGVLLWTTGESIGTILDIYFYALIVQVVMSWISQSFSNPLNGILFKLTEPLLKHLRKFVPIIAGLDLSPMLAMIFLKVIDILIVQPFIQLGQSNL